MACRRRLFGGVLGSEAVEGGVVNKFKELVKEVLTSSLFVTDTTLRPRRGSRAVASRAPASLPTSQRAANRWRK
jgi:hypothetical protein